MKLIRWKYVLPRLLVVLVIGLVVRFGLDPAVQWALVTGGESALGAKVELSAVRSSLWDGELDLEDLALANPQAPLKNLLEASRARMEIDVNALLHGRIVINDGTVSGLLFDTDRETSGALPESPSTDEAGPSVFDPLLASASDMGNQWLEDLGDRLDTDVADQLQSPKLAEELRERWPQQYQELEQQVKNIRTRGKNLQQTIREVKSNPLRGFERLAELQQELTALQAEVKSTQQRIGELPQQAAADRQAVLAAREADEALLRQKLKIGQLDGEGLTQTLLGKPVTENLATALGWIHWAREQIPASSTEPKELRGRGSTVLFTEAEPDYHVRQLQLEGAAQLNGKALQLVGTLTDASSAPRLLAQPTRLQLHGSEALELDLELVLDRRGEVATDRLQLSCLQLAMAGRRLGNANKLAIEMDAGLASCEVELTLVGETLSGEIVFSQDSLALTPRLAKSPDGELAKLLSNALAKIEQVEASVMLAGTLKKPQISINSDLGKQVAAGINSSAKQAVQQRTEALLAKTKAKVDAQLAELTQLREQAQAELLGQLGEGQEMLTQVTALLGNGNQKLGLPAGIPSLGKSLRLGGTRKK